MKKHRVALFLNDMNAAGGIQRVAANMARDLQQDFETVILTAYSQDRGAVFSEPGVTVMSLDFPYFPGKFYPGWREMLVMGRKLRRFVAENGIDTVICFWFHLAVIGALALPRSVKKIGFEHIPFAAAPGGLLGWASLRRWSYPRLDAVVSLSHDDSAEFASVSRQAHVIPNYVSLPAPRDVEVREKMLLTVGHIVFRKGLDRLLWALKDPLLANPDWKLVIVGGGEGGHEEHWYIPYLHDLANLLRIGGQVELNPASSRIDDWYARAAVYVMGSRQEGFPMVLLEAKSHGLPIISYNCPTGPREIVRHDVDGFLIDNDLPSFAAAATALMRDASLRQRMSVAAIEDVRDRFLSTRVCARWRNLIDAIHENRQLVEVEAASR